MGYGVKHYLLKPSNETDITTGHRILCRNSVKGQEFCFRVDSLLTQLFLTEMPPEKLLQRRFFTELSGEADVDLGRDPDNPSGNGEPLEKEFYPLQANCQKPQTVSWRINVCVTMNDLIPTCGAVIDLYLLCGSAAQIHGLCGKGHKVHGKTYE